MITKRRFFLSIQVWIFVVTICWLCAPAMGQTFVTSDPAIAIGNPTPTSQTIIVPVGTGTIADVDTSFFFNDTNGSFGTEMEFLLQSPTGTQVMLWDGSSVNGGGSITTSAGDSGTYYFDDDAPALSDLNITPVFGCLCSWKSRRKHLS